MDLAKTTKIYNLSDPPQNGVQGYPGLVIQ